MHSLLMVLATNSLANNVGFTLAAFALVALVLAFKG